MVNKIVKYTRKEIYCRNKYFSRIIINISYQV